MTTRKEQKFETHKKILSAAVHLISERGVNKTSIKDIANRAGVAVGTFYLYFNSKEDVIKCLDRDMHKKLLGKIKEIENLSRLQRIYKYISEWYKIYEDQEPGIIREWHCLNISSASDDSPNTLPGGEIEHSHVRELLQEAVEAGELDENMPLEDIARMLVCGMWGTSIYLCTAPNRKSRKKISADFLEYVVKPILNPYLVQ